MSLGLLGGVAAFNALLMLAGYGVLAPCLRGRNAVSWLSFAGLALLLGAGATGVVLIFVTLAGGRPTIAACIAVVAAIAAVGGVAARRRASREREPVPPGAPTRLADTVATAAACLLALLLAGAVVGGFRSSPWLDDTWFFWLPKGIFLREIGLDPRLFAGNGTYEFFANPDYPLLWSILTGLVVAFVGHVDLRAVNAELALLGAGFFGALARLAWGRVRPQLLWPCLLAGAAAPAFLDQLQGGGADLPEAMFLALSVAGALVWLAHRDTLGLLVVVVAGAAAASTRIEGAPELVAVLLPFALLARRTGRALATLGVAATAALATAVPWFIWERSHYWSSPAFAHSPAPGLFHRAHRLGPALRVMSHELGDPHRWLLLVPIVVVASLVLAARARRVLYALPALIVASPFLFWIPAILAQPHNRVGPALHRTLSAGPLLAVVLLPLVAEAIARERRAS